LKTPGFLERGIARVRHQIGRRGRSFWRRWGLMQGCQIDDDDKPYQWTYILKSKFSLPEKFMFLEWKTWWILTIHTFSHSCLVTFHCPLGINNIETCLTGSLFHILQKFTLTKDTRLHFWKTNYGTTLQSPASGTSIAPISKVRSIVMLWLEI
jgi:hypothetical protein